MEIESNWDSLDETEEEDWGTDEEDREDEEIERMDKIEGLTQVLLRLRELKNEGQ